jgi:hypothetical protein
MKLAGLPPDALRQVAAVTDGQIRVGVLMAVPGVLQELGEDPVALIQSAGVAPRLFADPRTSSTSPGPAGSSRAARRAPLGLT